MTTVNITQDMIDQKHYCDTSRCPVALGLIDAFGLTKDDFVCAGPYQLGIRRGAFDQEADTSVWVETPRHVSNWMYDFDASSEDARPVEPFSFEIDFKGI